MSPAALLVLVALGVWIVQTSAQRRRRGPARNPYNPRRRRRAGAGQLELPEAPAAYPVFSVGGGQMLPGRKKAPYWVIVQWAGVPSSDLRWFSHSVGRFSSPTAAAEAAREMARSERGVFEPSRSARRDLLRNRNPRRVPASAQPNPYTQACALPGGHVYDFAAGGRCQCCGRMAPKRTVELESRTGEHARYGSTCAGRSIGTTKLRTNQLAHIDREATERTAQRARYRGVRSERYGRLEGGVDRPPWAVGLTDAQLQRIARDHGVNASSEGWWEAVGLERGSGELRELLREGGYRKQYSGKGARGARGGRLERVPVTRSERARHRAIAAASAVGAGADLPF